MCVGNLEIENILYACFWHLLISWKCLTAEVVKTLYAPRQFADMSQVGFNPFSTIHPPILCEKNNTKTQVQADDVMLWTNNAEELEENLNNIGNKFKN